MNLFNRLISRASVLLIALAGLLPVQPAGASLPSSCIGTATITCVFDYVGSVQTFTVPTGVKSLTIEARGAQGAGAFGLGGVERGTVAVLPGQVFDVWVGGANGFNGGGASAGFGGNGGGASDVRPAGGTLADRIVTAGGGGGDGVVFAGAGSGGGTGGGGAGGEATGDCGTDGCGHGATDTSGGAGAGICPASATGTFGAGGAGCFGGSGGGGGWYGGGGGTDAPAPAYAGGGGSGHVASGVTNVFEQAGNQFGNGEVIFTFTPKPALVPTGHINCTNVAGTATLVPPLTNTPSMKPIKVKIAASGSCFSEYVLGGKGLITNATLSASLYLAPGANCNVSQQSTDKASKLKIKWQGLSPKNALYTIATTNTLSAGLDLSVFSWFVEGQPLTDPKRPFVNDTMIASGLAMSESPTLQQALCASTGLALVHIVNGQFGG